MSTLSKIANEAVVSSYTRYLDREERANRRAWAVNQTATALLNDLARHEAAKDHYRADLTRWELRQLRYAATAGRTDAYLCEADA